MTLLSQLRNVETLIATLIQVETIAQKVYLRFTEMFAHEPDAAQVWWQMGADEASHIRLLEQTLESLSPQQLQSPADPAMLETAQALSRVPYEKILSRIETLEDAYQEAHNWEYSELNALFEFVISEYFPKPVPRQFIQHMLREHVGRLDGLRTPEWRRTVRAWKGEEEPGQ